MFCCMLLYVHSSITIILMGKRELQLVALFNLSSLCLVMVEWLFLAKPWVWYSIVSFFLYSNTPLRGLCAGGMRLKATVQKCMETGKNKR